MGKVTAMLTPLCGLRVAAVEAVHDYLQLRFDDGDVLNVYNRAEVRSSLGAVQVTELAGLRVGAVILSKEAVRLEIGDRTLEIDLADEAFHGPEALAYMRQGSVWAVLSADDVDSLDGGAPVHVAGKT